MTAVEPYPGLVELRAQGVSGVALLVVRLAAAVTLLAACLVSSVGAVSVLTDGLAPVLVIHAWSVTVPGALPILLVFLAGLWVDALSHGPFGFWALAYVVAALTSDVLASMARRGLVGQTVSITVTLIVVVVLLWGGACVSGWRWVLIADLATAGLLAGLIYLSVAGLVLSFVVLGRQLIGRRANQRREAWP
jgi:hypothetical protein